MSAFFYVRPKRLLAIFEIMRQLLTFKTKTLLLGLASITTSLLFGCSSNSSSHTHTQTHTHTHTLLILGTAQDAGYPHIGCEKSCCKKARNTGLSEPVVSLAVIDENDSAWYLFEATPDVTAQSHYVASKNKSVSNPIPNGVFLTHAHIGHYTGLMYFGREAINTDCVPIYTAPRMKSFLETNGPWSQLIALNNVELINSPAGEDINLTNGLTVAPIQVPHRDEFSETVGYKIKGAQKTALFIPDIDKWAKWGKDIVAEIAAVDLAFLDATFYDGNEINNRDISEIPHPFVSESMELLGSLPESEKAKVHFIHLNHTNPLLDEKSEASKTVHRNGFNIARTGMKFEL